MFQFPVNMTCFLESPATSPPPPPASDIVTSTVSVSSAQLKTTNSNPVLIVGAPGINKMVFIMGAASIYAYGTTPYTGVNGPTLLFDSNPLTPAVSDSFFGFDGTSSEANTVIGGDDNQLPSKFINRPINLKDDFDWAGGNGTAKIFVAYSVIDFS